MLLRKLAEDIAEVRSQRQIAAFVKIARLQPRPLTIDMAAANCVAYDEHSVGVAVIRAARSVLARRASELGHREYDDIVHFRAEVCDERADAASEILQAKRELAASVPLVDVRVPAAYVREGYLKTYASLYQLRDLQH